MTLTIGTQFQVDTDGDDLARFDGLTNSTGIALYSSAASGIEARHLTNTDGIITGGAVLPIDANQADTVTICRLTATTALIGYAYGATHRTRVLTVTGTTLTAGTVKDMTDTGIDYATCKQYDAGKIIYCYSNAALDGVARVLTVASGLVTENAPFTYYSAFDAHHNVVEVFDTTEAIVVWVNSDTNNFVTGEILDISGTTITGNTEKITNTQAVITGDSVIDISRVYSDDTLIAVVSAGVAISTGQMTFFFKTGGGNLDSTGITGLNGLGGAANCVSIAAVYTDFGIAVVNDTTGPHLWIAEMDLINEVADDEDTSVSTAAGTSSVHVRLLPGSSDTINVWEATTESITVSLPPLALTIAPMTKPASIDASGTFIYMALLQGGIPILTKIATDLATDGTTVFNPGAGDNIGVQCGLSNADIIWIGGKFDGTNKLEKSEDGGTTFTVKDDATFADIETFIVGPDSDNRVLVADKTIEIQETVNSGATWQQINSSAGFNINAIARLGINVQESVFGGITGINPNVNYSVNSGADSESLSYPGASIPTGVIVN